MLFGGVTAKRPEKKKEIKIPEPTPEPPAEEKRRDEARKYKQF
jgi:hypothetical protein